MKGLLFMNTLKFNEDMIKKTFATFQNRFHEVRVLPHGNFKYLLSGFFNNPDSLIKQIKCNKLESTPMYMTLNKINPDTECILELNILRKSSKTICDKDILNYSFLHIDFDPEKGNPHCQATDEEVKYAQAKMNEVYNKLKDFGFPEPIKSFSGNGYNLDYYVNIPNTVENKDIFKQFLKLLSKLYSDEYVNIDTTTYNPGRIIKFFGCISGKGDNTPERPYRLTEIISVPDVKEELSIELICKFIGTYSFQDKPKTKTQGKHKAISTDDNKLVAKIADVEGWLNHYNISYDVKNTDYDGEDCTMYVIEDCVFTDHDNQNCSFIIVFKNGNCFYKCHHDHCNYTIHDLLKKYPLTSQLPLINGEGSKIDIFNTVAKNIRLVISDDNTKYVLRTDTNKLLNFDNSDFDNFIREKGQELGEMISNNAVTTIKSNFRTLFDKYAVNAPVSRRIAYKDGYHYYAIDRDCTIAIGDNKLLKYNGHEVFFYYSEHFKSQTMPYFKSPASALPELVKQTFNISDEYLLCFLAELCTLFIPEINNPVLVLSGGQGTSKSTTSKKLKALVDPANTEVMSMPDKEGDLLASLSSGYLVAYDNITNLSQTFSDILCIAVTKGTAPKRKLYSDNEVVEVKLNANIILNGIEDIVKKTDLAERCNIIYLDRITRRLTDRQVWSEFEANKPKLLGSIFNTIKLGLTYVDEMNKSITELPRMADFAVYGAAMIKAMGLDHLEFLEQYTSNTNELIGERAELDDFVVLVKNFLTENNSQWKGESKDLLTLLNQTAIKQRLPIDKFTATTLSRKLNTMQTSLAAVGIDFERGRDSKRYIALTLKSDESATSKFNIHDLIDDCENIEYSPEDFK